MKIPTDGKILNCEDAVKCIFNLKALDLIIYNELKKKGSLRADKLADILHKERSTVYRSLQKLTKCGICIKQTKNLKQGGYYHVYSIHENLQIKKKAEKCLEEWYNSIKKSLAELSE